MPQNIELANYYAERAAEYEQIYLKPERQPAIEWLNSHLTQLLSGRKVLEIACGTGFWTQTIAKSALSVVATDVNDQVLDIAQRKPLPVGKVKFVKDDAFLLQNIPDEEFSAGFAGFWWSHIPKSQLNPFLEAFHSKLQPGSSVMFADNLYVEGSNHPLVHTDSEGNTYQDRILQNGTRYEVLKNFPTQQELESAVQMYGEDFQYRFSKYYWCFSYTLGVTTAIRAAA